MVNARFDYTYDNSFRVTSMQAVINETPLPIDLYQFDDISGKVEQFGKFGVIYYDINQVRWMKLFNDAQAKALSVVHPHSTCLLGIG